jgi:hypothetical protein
MKKEDCVLNSFLEPDQPAVRYRTTVDRLDRLAQDDDIRAALRAILATSSLISPA